MNSSTKLATGLALACTWTTVAQADDFHLDFVSSVEIPAVRLFTNRQESISNIRTEETLSDLYGPVLANETYTFNVSTNYATSASVSEPGPYAETNLLGVFNDGSIAVAGDLNGSRSPFSNVPSPQAVSGILSGDTSVARSLTTDQYVDPTDYAIYGVSAARSNTLPLSATLYRFDTAGTRTQIGSITVAKGLGTQRLPAPVPEPATMAALGISALALLRRRRKA